tara:strand:+ start:1112 stop:2236 length:1125 start_codon:yes stop_codon:yes gene_type:complete
MDWILNLNLITISLLIIFLLFILEIAFIIAYKIKNGVPYKFLKKIPLKKMHIIPHPYLPFIYKKGATTSAGVKHYPNNQNYFFPALKTNNLQFFNGEFGDRDIEIPKPKNLVRINCLGASTTANYVREKDKNYSYPLILEKKLQSKYKNRIIEVNNCAQGGYNSADILVRSALKIVDTKPDYVILYHAYNDIRSYLTDNFSSDYSHSKKNLGDSYWKFHLSSLLPEIPLNFYNYLINKFLPSSSIRYSLLEVTGNGSINTTANYQLGLETYERNMKNIINLYQSINAKIILCTFSFYLYEEIKNNKLHSLYCEIVKEENKIIERISKQFDLPLVDADKLIPKNKENFGDTIHFSKSGMEYLASLISEKIKLDVI